MLLAAPAKAICISNTSMPPSCFTVSWVKEKGGGVGMNGKVISVGGGEREGRLKSRQGDHTTRPGKLIRCTAK